MPDHAESLHFLHAIVAVRDDPVARDQLRRHFTRVADRQRVGKGVLVAVRVGLFGQVARRDRHAEFILGHRFSNSTFDTGARRRTAKNILHRLVTHSA
jgi:hypothetical protein